MSVEVICGYRCIVKNTGYIYFIQMGFMGPIKIGLTKDIDKRLVSLQTGSPYPLRLLSWTPGNEETEKYVHDLYRDHRLEGEWFLPHPDLVQDIEYLEQLHKDFNHPFPVPERDLVDVDLMGH